MYKKETKPIEAFCTHYWGMIEISLLIFSKPVMRSVEVIISRKGFFILTLILNIDTEMVMYEKQE